MPSLNWAEGNGPSRLNLCGLVQSPTGAFVKEYFAQRNPISRGRKAYYDYEAKSVLDP